MDFPARLLHLLREFPLPARPLPHEVQARNAYHDPVIAEVFGDFARRYYAADQPRVGLFGINPGRFGSGRTGVAFTDPTALTELCGITHTLGGSRRRELSSEFVYQFIAELGGPAEFYRHFYLSSLYPLELTRAGKNYNYYDSGAVTNALWPDIQRSLRQQTGQLGLRRDVAVSLGRRNGEFFQRLNDELKLFDRLIILDHPRFLMQYRRRALADNVQAYVQTLGELI